MDFLLLYARHGPFARFRKSAFRAFCRRDRGRNRVVQTKSGFSMSTVIGDRVDDVIYVYGEYEPGTTRVIRRWAPACACFIDVGCNIGYYSCLYRSANAGGRLFAIDPNAEMIRRTEENLKGNGFSNYELLACGIGSREGTLPFHIPRNRHSLGSFAYVPTARSAGPVDTVEVGVRTLSGIIGEHDIEDAFLKVDAEGFEHEVFAGLSHEAAERIRCVVLELSRRSLAQAGVSADSILGFPWMDGFSFFLIDSRGETREEDRQALVRDRERDANVLLVRRGGDLEKGARDHGGVRGG